MHVSTRDTTVIIFEIKHDTFYHNVIIRFKKRKWGIESSNNEEIPVPKCTKGS